MKELWTIEQLKKEISSKRNADKDWFLNLLDEEKQKAYEDTHIRALLAMLRFFYIAKEQETIRQAQKELAEIRNGDDHSAVVYSYTTELNRTILQAQENIESYKHFFDEPYFARMDAIDEKEGYNAYYIGKKGDLNLGIVDWRAPLSKRYYQKSQRNFSINEYDYEVILRRAIRTKSGKVLDFTNEHLNLRNYLSKEEIAGRDAESVLDPYLREIIRARKDEESVRDIIETIQEQQFDLITRPERENFIVQGCAGSGKTMVLLHRLSYLMYNNEDLRPQDILVITPSRSFNSFIDELAEVLELGKVKTYTLQDYFAELLTRAGIEVEERLNNKAESVEYLRYVFSNEFPKELKSKLDKIYEDVYGMFTSEECRTFASYILEDCRKQKEAYTNVKNASVRLRRTVLGEIKESPEGGLHYTRPFREFMNHISQIEDFLTLGLEEEKERSQAYFYRQLALFYKSASYVEKNAERVIEDTMSELNALDESIVKEIRDLKRYRQRIGTREEFTYPERIAAREALLEESQKIREDVKEIGERCTGFSDFFSVLAGQKNLRELGKCADLIDVVRYFYRETVKEKKLSFGMTEKGLYKSDVYALLYIMALIGMDITPRYTLIFVDEGQDISSAEYGLLRLINTAAAFNVYGDLKQNITPWRGVTDWSECVDATVYKLNQNYRNTGRIVDFVSGYLDADMRSIGFDGDEVKTITVKEISSFFKEEKGLKAIIALPEHIPMLRRSTYNVVSETGVISKKKVNLMTVYESKGLEFGCVAVYDGGMSVNEQYIAFTRALKTLAVVKDKK